MRMLILTLSRCLHIILAESLCRPQLCFQKTLTVTETAKEKQQSTKEIGFEWINYKNESLSQTRQLTNVERMFYILNKDLHGQNCPFFGATINIQRSESSQRKTLLDFKQLQERSIVDFSQTRWKYPTVAARVVDGADAVYIVDSTEGIWKWARRTVSLGSSDGGWLPLREELNRKSSLPTPDNDYCVMYLVVHPDEIEKSELTTFDVLMHIHHVFIDGAGIRSIFNEFLNRLASPLPSEEIRWGREVERLHPAAPLLLKDEGHNHDPLVANGIPRTPSTRDEGPPQPDLGLPLYRPDIGPPSFDTRGILLASHTFEPMFLPHLLDAGRKHGVKLAAVLHAALLTAVKESADSNTAPDGLFKSASALDFRSLRMTEPFLKRNEYMNSAAAVQPIEVPARLFGSFWDVAKHVGNLWEGIKVKKGMMAQMELEAGAFLDSWGQSNSSNSWPNSMPRTCPYFVSDPPGSQQLDSEFKVSGDNDLLLIIGSYQLATDQNQTVVSARSHSWQNKLTLCLVFNAMRNPKNEMESVLSRWVGALKGACEVENGI